MGDKKFQGFVLPKCNYFRVPNDWTDIMNDMTSMSEIKVVLYVLRHTWGYCGEEYEPKRISLEEFMHGRKNRRTGKRIDKGTGLSINSVRDGLSRAMEHGFLGMIEDNRVPWRVKRYYYLIMRQTDDTPHSRVSTSDTPHSRVSTSDTLPLSTSDTLPLSTSDTPYKKDNRQKDNPRKKKDKERGRQAAPLSGVIKNTKNKKRKKSPPSPMLERTGLFGSDKIRGRRRIPHLTKFDRKAAAYLRVMFNEHEIPKLMGARVDRIAEQIYLLRQRYDKSRIFKLLVWWKEHYGEQYVPRVWKLGDIFDKFERVEQQREIKAKESTRINGKKITRDSMFDAENCVNGIPRVWVSDDGKEYDGLLLHDLRNRVRERFGSGLPLQSQVDIVLVEMDKVPGSIPVNVVGKVG